MFPEYLPPLAEPLTELTSISLAQAIIAQPVTLPAVPQPILTTYVRQGNRQPLPPILLLHGFDSSVLEFRRLLPLLANSTETWAVDLFGFGFTQRSPYLTVNPTHILAHLYAFWQSTINQPVILVGASMGGATAIDFTLNHPQAVQSLVLIDSAGINKGPIAGKFLFPPFDYLATEFLRQPKVRQSISENAYFDKSLASRDAQLCAAWHLQSPLWNRGLIEFTKSGGYGAFGDRLNTIQQPTLILWGKNDKILGTKDAHKFRTAIPNSQLIWIDKCGHVPHLEQPQITANQILEFVN
ncbi:MULTISPECIES: alpha/beta fold hydrolase [Limnospira]|jgi:pimeloyl-ACP methyl ester carboxylesterase|uniref:2-hydroxy-6-oxohepta-2,4-dienoate hydrolase n=1 Tax=Limnospira platensis NIES-46 TaxID=1236695 RepID=A0A5M3SZF1_LIMPL|nr:alpha/beta hydrolase [Arthrospira platensis]MDF2207848.1 alpha/beta hydrolase [Arthrospira platensis NCB002]MDT9184155.1 alpha/beta hydrolase [Limnospira sp. PMC 289.06]MDT9296336.1 alpha/beta hydrolase [Arthrospira platensis PCC 7345]BAI92894.1 putative 2-hydroxy-6-oxohepta-2,4-dienoate hydrolase [Arthrospira platensis NIES-39]BDT15135.1 putative 2-hydroxy-6-oxohepta-2,4-dienoate hydrolase [Arthrospira platensis NIES-39]